MSAAMMRETIIILNRAARVYQIQEAGKMMERTEAEKVIVVPTGQPYSRP
jgi:hypothetical protein